MKKLYLTSSFADVADLFKEQAGAAVKGNRITFIPTASIVEEYTAYVTDGKKALEKIGFLVDELEISTAPAEEIADKLQHNDYIYVSGGNTFFLLQELKRTGADEIIKKQVEAGKVYIGESAGSIVAAPDITYAKDMDDPGAASGFSDYEALHFVPFYPVPHYTEFPFAEAAEKILAAHKTSLTMLPITNTQMILVSGGETQIVNA